MARGFAEHRQSAPPKTRSGLAKFALFAAIAYGLGFLLFTTTLPAKPAVPPKADAIVVLTGGDARLNASVALFERGVGKRLLISGVHRGTTKDDLKRLARGGARFDCCADLGFAATDTRSNALEAAGWMKKHGYRSLILVTARYHMPRSLAEFSAAMPNVRVEPYPVDPEGVDFAQWWRDPHALRVLQLEYVKYLASLVANSVGTGVSDRTDTRQARTGGPHS